VELEVLGYKFLGLGLSTLELIHSHPLNALGILELEVHLSPKCTPCLNSCCHRREMGNEHTKQNDKAFKEYSYFTVKIPPGIEVPTEEEILARCSGTHL
jgi:hypothetical protein